VWYLPANTHALVYVESRNGLKNDISESSQIKNGTDGLYYGEKTAGINTLYTIGKAEYITDASYYIDGVVSTCAFYPLTQNKQVAEYVGRYHTQLVIILGVCALAVTAAVAVIDILIQKRNKLLYKKPW
jgi:hypothetical protein